MTRSSFVLWIALAPSILLTLVLPFFMSWVIRAEAHRKAERQKWLAAYRASSESHLLHLND